MPAPSKGLGGERLDTTRTDELGAFTLTAKRAVHRGWILIIGKLGYVPLEVSGSVADLDAQVFALQEAGALEGRVLTDPWVPLSALHVAVVGVGRRRELGLAEHQGRFRFENLKPGLATVTVALNDSSWILHTIGEVQIEAGALAEGGRLASVDVRSQLQWFHVRLQSAGRPVATAGIELSDGVTGRCRNLASGADGTLRVLVPQGLDNNGVYLSAPGYQAEWVYAPAPGQVVHLIKTY